ncbi:hypothetical protein F5X97DRAFT_307326 [Nemania serpens]|nr:hypothetical protein F5X97DRAFT_307326 [Nemania serpens]
MAYVTTYMCLSGLALLQCSVGTLSTHLPKCPSSAQSQPTIGNFISVRPCHVASLSMEERRPRVIQRLGSYVNYSSRVTTSEFILSTVSQPPYYKYLFPFLRRSR